MARYFLVVRRRANGREDEITRYSTVGMTGEQIETIRSSVYAGARAAKLANLSWVVWVYGPDDDDDPPELGDALWNSEVEV